MNKKNKASKKYYKPTFDKIQSEKRKKIIDTAVSEFAANGYNATSINTIAKKANISIGSMYSYFDSKECLFMTLLDQGYTLLSQALEEVVNEDGDFYSKLRKLLEVTYKYSVENHEINQIYIDISTEGLSHLANEMSFKMESDTAKIYHALLEQAKEEGIVSDKIDTKIVSFCLDNIIMMIQFSFASEYYSSRMKLFLGEDNISNYNQIIDKTMQFLEQGLKPRN